jgi:hypothetical protein
LQNLPIGTHLPLSITKLYNFQKASTYWTSKPASYYYVIKIVLHLLCYIPKNKQLFWIICMHSKKAHIPFDYKKINFLLS